MVDKSFDFTNPVAPLSKNWNAHNTFLSVCSILDRFASGSPSTLSLCLSPSIFFVIAPSIVLPNIEHRSILKSSPNSEISKVPISSSLYSRRPFRDSHENATWPFLLGTTTSFWGVYTGMNVTETRSTPSSFRK